MGPFEAARIRHITRKGRTMTITRDGTTSQTLLGFFSQWSAEDIAGTVLRQGDVRIDTLATSMGDYPVPPRDPDLITAAGTAYTVLFSYPIYEGETLIGWVMAVRGE